MIRSQDMMIARRRGKFRWIGEFKTHIKKLVISNPRRKRKSYVETLALELGGQRWGVPDRPEAMSRSKGKGITDPGSPGAVQ